MRPTLLLFLSVFFLASSCNPGKNKVIIYDAPGSLIPSKLFRLRANGKPVFVYGTKVGYDAFDLESERDHPDSAAFAYFDFSGSVNIEIEPVGMSIDTVIIRPLSRGLIPQVNGRTISFTLDTPQMLSVEINGNDIANLMLFANGIEEYTPDPADPNTLYFGPGIHEADDEYGFLELKSDQTLYIAGGAVLRARIIVEDAENVAIEGRGILDGSLLKGRWPPRLRKLMGEPVDVKRPGLVNFKNSSHVSMKGIILMDAPMWTTTFSNCDDVHVQNTKTIGYVINSDGINLVSCRNALIEDVFVRTGDDCICIKAHFERDHSEVSSDIVVKNSVLWADVASPLEIGHETNTSEIKNIYFTNIDILQQQFKVPGYHAIDITNADDARIHDIYFKNIRIERCLRLIGIRIMDSYWMSTDTKGKVENIFFENISTLADTSLYLYGYDAAHAVRNVSFKNFFRGTMPFSPLKNLHINNFVYDLKYMENDAREETFYKLFPDGLRFLTMDISPYCNRIWGDSTAGDGADWLDTGNQHDFSALKGGSFVLGDIPFRISDDGVLMLRSEKRMAFLPRTSGKIPVGKNARFILFLHTTAFGNSEAGTKLWDYKINYQNGRSAVIPVLSLTDVADWELWSRAGWQFTLEGKKVYVMAVENKFGSPIESIEIISGSKEEIPVVMAITLGI